jgi:hypothetical protein
MAFSFLAGEVSGIFVCGIVSCLALGGEGGGFGFKVS